MTAGSFEVRSAPFAWNEASGPIAAEATATDPNRSTSRRLGPEQSAENLGT